jgi:hypothetical protein
VWSKLRVAVLLVVLAVVALQAWYDRSTTTSWHAPLWVGVIPVNGDGSGVAARYVAALDAQEFAPIGEFFDRESRRYGLPVDQPVHVRLYGAVRELPPSLERGAGPLQAVWWSLRMRWYAWMETRSLDGPAPRIRVFVLYHDPALTPTVPHSLGLQNGLVGVVNAFATPSMRGGNAIVIAHELLHTLGATDKYDPDTLAPLFPDGFGDPAQQPRFPQRTAEIMAGRRALSPTTAQMPESLAEVVVGSATAREIRWLR